MELDAREKYHELKERISVVEDRSERTFTYITNALGVAGLIVTLLAVFGFIFVRDYKQTVIATSRNTIQDEIGAKRKEIDQMLKNCKKYEEDGRKLYEKLNTYSASFDEAQKKKDGITQDVLQNIASLIEKSKHKNQPEDTTKT